MIGYIVEKTSGHTVASIKAILPYGMVIAKGENVYTMVLDVEFSANAMQAIKACAKVVYTSHGWSKKTHKLILDYKESG